MATLKFGVQKLAKRLIVLNSEKGSIELTMAQNFGVSLKGLTGIQKSSLRLKSLHWLTLAQSSSQGLKSPIWLLSTTN